MKHIPSDIKGFLDEKVFQYNTPAFIESDPISIPHRFDLKEDIEIAGFLAATIAWGNRTMIIKNASRLVGLMGNSPYDFIMNHDEHDLDRFNGFVHRTFNASDLVFFMKAIQNIYQNHGGLESVFSQSVTPLSTQPAIHEFKKVFFSCLYSASNLLKISSSMVRFSITSLFVIFLIFRKIVYSRKIYVFANESLLIDSPEIWN